MRHAKAALGGALDNWRQLADKAVFPVAAAAVLGTLAVLEVMLGPETFESNRSIALLLGLGATAPLAFAREQLMTSAAATTVAALVTVGTFQRVTGAALVALVAILYLLGSRRPRWVAALAMIPFVLYAALVAVSGSGPAGDDAVDTIESPDQSGGAVAELGPDDAQPDQPGDSLFPLLLAAVAATAAGIGAAAKTRAEAAERAASHRVVTDTMVAHAARGERARIARELHDVVAHHISMISVQAETARLATPGMPVEGAERLQEIGDAARTALAEMRSLLGVLREDAGGEPPREPQPGLAHLVELIDESRHLSAGGTRLIVRGQVHQIDAGLGLTIYRIVQEALTNARRHAPGAAVDVELDCEDDTVELRIRDTGPGRRRPGADPAEWDSAPGLGLLGMRERVVSAGGELRIGTAPSGGFLVEATLPVRAASSAMGATPPAGSVGAVD